MRRFEAFFRDLPLSLKLLISYSSVFVITILLGGFVIYYFVRSSIQANIESELHNTTATILSMVRTAAGTSIKNHLRAVAEQNRKIIEFIHRRQQDGLMTEAQAKAQAREILLSQTIGKTGYIYCADSLGRAPVHPNPGVEGGSFLRYKFVRDQIELKEGYLEYEWRNPGEDRQRSKALYMTYFEPWDWIISVSSYREEFVELVKVTDFSDSILALRFGKTGYSFVLDSNANSIVHPVLTGSVLEATDAHGRAVCRTICEAKKGKLVYSWRNPGEEVAREKLVIFDYLPEYDWIVASSCYLDESYAALTKVRDIVFATVIGTLLLVIPVTLVISGSILRPLESLMQRFFMGQAGDLSVRMATESRDEVGQLAKYFNEFMEKLEGYRDKLVAEVRERRQTAEALKESEHKYRSILERMQEGYYELDLDGTFTFYNNALTSILGYSGEELLRTNICDIADPGSLEDIAESLRMIRRTGKVLKASQCELIKKDGTVCSVESSVSLIHDKIGKPVGFKGVLRDITERKRSERLEREILEISEREHRKIGRDLHDDLCPHLIGIEVLSRVLVQKLQNGALTEADDAERIRVLIEGSIGKLRRLSRGLCPIDLEDGGLAASLAALGRYVEDIFGVEFRLDCDGPIGVNDRTVATHLYYIAHEAVHNAVKHADAKGVLVTLTTDDGMMELTITDDGKGLPEDDSSNGMGLRIMHYRARRIGATLEMRSGSDGGTVVALRMRAV